MSKQRGKAFEREVSKMLREHPGIVFVNRNQDPSFNSKTKFALANPIDFICICKSAPPLVIECKAVKGTSLPFSRLPAQQWRALYRCWRGNAQVIILINRYGWPGRDGARGRCYVVPFGELAREHARLHGIRKSWPLDWLAQFPEIEKVGSGWKNLRF